jgi:hypothetical protein
MLRLRLVIVGLSAAIGVLLLARGFVLLGVLLLLLALARLAMLSRMMRHRAMRRDFRLRRRARLHVVDAESRWR